MTPLEYKTKYNLTNVTLFAILRLYYQYSDINITMRAVQRIDRPTAYLNMKCQLPEYEPVDIIESMAVLNKMVKDPTCPGNKRNQFYHHKHTVLHKLLDSGLIERIEKQDGFLLFIFTWDGKQYCFHQPAEYYKNTDIEKKTTVVDGGCYTRDTGVVPFDEELFFKWRITILHHMTSDGIKLTQDDEES